MIYKSKHTVLAQTDRFAFLECCHRHQSGNVCLNSSQDVRLLRAPGAFKKLTNYISVSQKIHGQLPHIKRSNKNTISKRFRFRLVHGNSFACEFNGTLHDLWYVKKKTKKSATARDTLGSN